MIMLYSVRLNCTTNAKLVFDSLKCHPISTIRIHCTSKLAPCPTKTPCTSPFICQYITMQLHLDHYNTLHPRPPTHSHLPNRSTVVSLNHPQLSSYGSAHHISPIRVWRRTLNCMLYSYQCLQIVH